MKKLLQGVVEFRKNLQPDQMKVFAQLALGQSPDTLFIACSDSRVAANVFASTNPGDLFVIRNVANLVPPWSKIAQTSDSSAAAAIEFAINQLKVQHIVVCGHSECGGNIAVLNGREKIECEHLKAWLQHGEQALEKLKDCQFKDSPHNKLAKLNVLQQLDHLRSYPVVKRKIDEGTLQLHGWFFQLGTAEVFYYSEDDKDFLPIDEHSVRKIMPNI